MPDEHKDIEGPAQDTRLPVLVADKGTVRLALVGPGRHLAPCHIGATPSAWGKPPAAHLAPVYDGVRFEPSTFELGLTRLEAPPASMFASTIRHGPSST
jgi:hypothetical protein